MKKAIISHIILLVLLILGIAFLASCKPKIQYIPVESVKTEYRDRLLKDSIYILDSIFIYSRNDTVFLNKYKYIYKDRLKKDSIFIRDTIRVPYPIKGETVEVNKLKWHQEASIWFTSLVLVALAIYMTVRYRSKILSIFRKMIFKA